MSLSPAVSPMPVSLTPEQFRQLAATAQWVAFVPVQAPAMATREAPTRAPARVPERKKPRGFQRLHAAEDVLMELERFKTAEQLARDLRVSKGTAHRYIAQLIRAKKVETRITREGKRGPQSVAYRAAEVPEPHASIH